MFSPRIVSTPGWSDDVSYHLRPPVVFTWRQDWTAKLTVGDCWIYWRIVVGGVESHQYSIQRRNSTLATAFLFMSSNISRRHAVGFHVIEQSAPCRCQRQNNVILRHGRINVADFTNRYFTVEKYFKSYLSIFNIDFNDRIIDWWNRSWTYVEHGSMPIDRFSLSRSDISRHNRSAN